MMTPKKLQKERKPLPIVVHVGFTKEMIQRIEKQAEVENRSRLNMIQTLVLRGLATLEEGQR
jgi:hypothetical protein